MAYTEDFTVDDTNWMVEKLGEDVLPDQDKRELTENAVLAAQRVRQAAADAGEEPARGEVRWDVDELYFAEHGVRKLAIIDTGDAFDEPSFRQNMMQLAPRGTEHGTLIRFGVGAKIAGVTRHPFGMIYQSWKSPEDGIYAHLWRDPDTGRYGLRRHETDDGKLEAVIPIDGTDRPELIETSGTKVTLLGTDADDDTFAPPADSPHGGKWLSRYLNTRYFELPDDVRLQVREGEDYIPGHPDTGRLRTITGQRTWLDANSVEHDLFIGDDFRIWWWILEDDPRRLKKDSHYATAGFASAKFLHEMFDLRDGRHAPATLQKFGVTFGFTRVVLVVEPGVTSDDPDAAVEPVGASVDLQRAHLKHNGAPLDWDRYAAAFRKDMPEPVRSLVEDEAEGGTDEDRRRRYRSHMEKIRDLFHLPRYRPTPSGDAHADPERPGPGGDGAHGDGEAAVGTARPHRPGGTHPSGRTGNLYPLRRKTNGVPATTTNELPDVDFSWLSDVDPALPSRHGQMEDRAARYLAETNELHINADFRLFDVIVDHWMQTYGSRPAARHVIIEAVRDVYTGVLVETVVGLLALKGDELWSDERLAAALSEEALTAAVMPRVAPHRQVGQILRGHFPGAA